MSGPRRWLATQFSFFFRRRHLKITSLCTFVHQCTKCYFPNSLVYIYRVDSDIPGTKSDRFEGALVHLVLKMFISYQSYGCPSSETVISFLSQIYNSPNMVARWSVVWACLISSLILCFSNLDQRPWGVLKIYRNSRFSNLRTFDSSAPSPQVLFTL